jgi:hypothetical protein
MTYDAVITVPIAPSAAGAGLGPIQKNIGVIRNTNLELTAQATLVQRSALYWNVSGTLTHTTNRVVRLNPGTEPISVALNLDASRSVSSRIIPGYPIDGMWAYPILGYADNNNDGIIQGNEVLVGDSLQYLGPSQPSELMAFNTDLAVLNGRLTVHTTVTYQTGMTQFNQAGANTSANIGQYPATVLFGNDPSSPLSQQAAFAVLMPDASRHTGYGLAQTVNMLRWQSLSINYEVPTSVASWFRVHRMTIAVQGSNLGLHTNYRGKDPNVNAYPNGDITGDTGQLPEPRTFYLKFTLGN